MGQTIKPRPTTASAKPAASARSGSPAKSAASAKSISTVKPGSAAKPNSAKERRQAEIAQRIEANRLERASQTRRERLRRGAIIGGGVVVAGLVVWLIVLGLSGGGSSSFSNPIAGVVTFSNLTSNHVTGAVTYKQTPPVGGDHSQVWLNCGIYNAPVPNENAVHSLEHGSVWITYQPTLASGDVAQLATMVRGHDHALLSPYTGIPSPIVASAWGAQLKVDSATDPRLRQFLSKYENSTSAPEPGGACSGGTGTPTS